MTETKNNNKTNNNNTNSNKNINNNINNTNNINNRLKSKKNSKKETNVKKDSNSISLPKQNVRNFNFSVNANYTTKYLNKLKFYNLDSKIENIVEKTNTRQNTNFSDKNLYRDISKYSKDSKDSKESKNSRNSRMRLTPLLNNSESADTINFNLGTDGPMNMVCCINDNILILMLILT